MRARAILTGATMTLLLMAACSSDDDPVPPSTVKAGARIDFVNLYLDDTENTFQVDGKDVTSPLGYLWVSLKRSVQWDKSAPDVRIRVVRTVNRTELTHGDFPLTDGGSYMCFLTGASDDDAFLQPVMRDDTPPTSGMARVRFFHALPGDPSVDVYAGGTTQADLLAPDLGWRSMSPYVDVSAQALGDTLIIVPAGADARPENALVYITGSNQYRTGSVYTLAAIRAQPDPGANRTVLILEQE